MKGRVQGVYFRKYTQEKASRLEPYHIHSRRHLSSVAVVSHSHQLIILFNHVVNLHFHRVQVPPVHP